MNPLELLVEWLSTGDNWRGPDGIPTRTLQHLFYCGAAIGVASLIAIPLGVSLGHRGRGRGLVLGSLNAMRALPTLGILTLFVIVSGVGLMPVLVALVLIAIPPILVSTYEGVRGVEPATVDAARAMGMRRSRIAWGVEVPIATPLIIVGLRTSVVQVVSTATIAAFVGIGGLGRYIFDGLAQRDFGQLAGGSLLVALLALTSELTLSVLSRALAHHGTETTSRTTEEV